MKNERMVAVKCRRCGCNFLEYMEDYKYEILKEIQEKLKNIMINDGKYICRGCTEISLKTILEEAKIMNWKEDEFFLEETIKRIEAYKKQRYKASRMELIEGLKYILHDWIATRNNYKKIESDDMYSEVLYIYEVEILALVYTIDYLYRMKYYIVSDDEYEDSIKEIIRWKKIKINIFKSL